jgi:hypothetical protein
VQEHLGAYRCLSDEYPQQIVPWCLSSRSGAHVRRRTPRGRPRGTAWRTATRQPVVLVVGPQWHPSAHTRASTLAPGAGRGVCMVSRPIMAPGATPARLWAGEVEHRGGRDGVVSLARRAPSVHAPWAWRMTSAPLPVRSGKRPRRAAPRRPSMAGLRAPAQPPLGTWRPGGLLPLGVMHSVSELVIAMPAIDIRTRLLRDAKRGHERTGIPAICTVPYYGCRTAWQVPLGVMHRRQ